MKTFFLLFILFIGLTNSAIAEDTTIKIGVLSSLTGLPNQAKPFDNGAQMAVNDINKQGGILGRPLGLVIRDDKNDPSHAALEAERLTEEDKVSALTGAFLDNVSMAVSTYVKKAKIPYLKPTGGTDNFVWKNGNHYGFLSDTSTDVLAEMLAKEAARNPAKRWAVIAPDYEYGHAIYAAFRRHLSELRPDVTWVAERYVPYNKIEAGSIVQVINQAKPDAIFAAIFYGDLIKFNREANKRGFFKDTFFVAPYLGWPESLQLFGKEAPVGWVTQGFPYMSFDKPALKAFVDQYTKQFGESPAADSFDGYIAIQFIAAAIAKAGAPDRDAITNALKGVEIKSPAGALAMRAQDNQSTMGAWIGKTGFLNEKPTILDWHYIEPAFPDDTRVKVLRSEE